MPKKSPRLFKYKFFTVVLLAGLFVLIVFSIQQIPLRNRLVPSFVDETKVLESSQGGLVEDFPDFPKYHGAEVIESKKEMLGDQVTYIAEYRLREGEVGVISWYMDNLAEDGFALGEMSESGNKLYAYLNKVTYAFEVKRIDSGSKLIVTATYDED